MLQKADGSFMPWTTIKKYCWEGLQKLYIMKSLTYILFNPDLYNTDVIEMVHSDYHGKAQDITHGMSKDITIGEYTKDACRSYRISFCKPWC